ncbi:hypothetical protein GALMADRAFT_258652 [Galerina marginata CBS 339.88]|uniref:Uncharacterized protein n=1 Tax=Galerina marginata (strain CBS 339.88) TaxID=685588 RepID=A0A067SH08_GALM3|nr:hypothetical protein GALMADRAFT_258652 [Galerina marginata CBS 339.88]
MPESWNLEPEGTDVESPPHGSWHPKVTPYRLTVIVTTTFLGTAKTILTQRGSTLAPVTLEWILGVVLFTFFHVANEYDSGELLPDYISWFFSFDCMDLPWSFLTRFALPQPTYTSDQSWTIFKSHPGHPFEKPSSHPPITFYRIFVSSSVVLFGGATAALTYHGYSTVVTWLDWFVGVFMATSLYILGLYEYNSSNIWPAFFAHDQTRLLHSVNRVILMIIYAGVFISLNGLMISGLWNDKGSQAGTVTGAIPPTLLDKIHAYNMSLLVYLLFFYLLALAFYVLLPGLATLVDIYIDSIYVDSGISLLGTVGCLSMSTTLMGGAIRLHYELTGEEGVTGFIMTYVIAVFTMLFGFAFTALGLFILHSTVKPLYSYRRK